MSFLQPLSLTSFDSSPSRGALGKGVKSERSAFGSFCGNSMENCEDKTLRHARVSPTKGDVTEGDREVVQSRSFTEKISLTPPIKNISSKKEPVPEFFPESSVLSCFFCDLIVE